MNRNSHALEQRAGSAVEAQKTIPQQLYKYRSLRGSPRIHLEQLFKEGKVYFPSPGTFNDPFDCRAHMRFEGTNQEYKRYLLEVVRKHKPDLNSKQVKALVAEALQVRHVHKNPEIHSAMLADIQRDLNAVGMYCLCERPDDIRMWSYYADGHTGLCLQFEHVVSFGVAHDVTYAQVFPQVSFLRDSARRQMEANLLTKAAQWVDEREWRIIDYERGPGLRKLSPQVVSGVIFGCRMPKEDRELVANWITAGPFNPDLYEAMIKEGEYALEIRRLSNGALLGAGEVLNRDPGHDFS